VTRGEQGGLAPGAHRCDAVRLGVEAREAQAGDLSTARQTLAEAALRLREAGDPVELAKLLCQAAFVALQDQDRQDH
jgi:hypothetical protein